MRTFSGRGYMNMREFCDLKISEAQGNTEYDETFEWNESKQEKLNIKFDKATNKFVAIYYQAGDNHLVIVD